MPYNTLEKARAHAKEHYASDPEVRRKQQEATAAWEATLPAGKWYTPEYGRRKQIERRYKMTVEQYEELLASQGGHCALCPAVQGTHKRRLTVDHDHTCCDREKACGECNRGILCADCNRKLGFLEETLREGTYIANPETWSERALQYLEEYAKETQSTCKA